MNFRLWVISTALAFLAGCGNTYGPPPAESKPQNFGQQHYLDNQLYQQQTQDRLNSPE
jgi:hypothetical protein